MRTLVLALLLVSTKAFGWGSTGHRVVGAIAEKHLEPAVGLKVFQLLGGNSLSRVANWPDEIKSEPQNYSYTFNWHYTDWREEDHDHDETKSSGKLLTSIREQVNVLKDPKATDASKVFAIKFIVHLVGDIHQPLHVGNGLDQGGNKCKVSFQGKAVNLHQVWDESMIDFTNLSFTEIANYVAMGRTREELIAWRSGDVTDWARESKEIRATIYPAEVNPNPQPMSVKQYCRSDIVVAPEEMPKLSYDYSYKFVPVMEKRLFQAGLRLAMLLNEALK